MRRTAPTALLALALTLGATEAHASGEADAEADAIDRTARTAYAEHKYAFCTDPTRPLRQRQENLCELAAEIEECAGYSKACGATEPKPSGWLERLLEVAAPLAKVLLYVLVGAIAVMVAIPLIHALRRLRRRRAEGGLATLPENRAELVDAPPRTEPLSDAEVALRIAEEHRQRGELKASLGLYLVASLVALDRRGAVRLARHRTNGEYVRSCADEGARSPLREIVREVDRVEFGGAAPDGERVAGVARLATTIVRSIATSAVVLALGVVGVACSPQRAGADPAGDELPADVLARNGFDVSSLATSLATLPIPDERSKRAAMPVVLVDVEKVPLEPEAQAHLVRWVDAGGVLVLFGHVGDWPEELQARSLLASTRDLVVRTAAHEEGAVAGARAARRDAFEWNDDARTIAFLGESTYAATRRFGSGLVLGVANDDLLTNVGMMPRRNPAALVSLVRAAAGGRRELRIARPEDGVPPPSSPFAALVAAGLGKGAWHALVAALVLFLAYGIRQALPRSAPRRPRRAFAEHVEATAALYGRTQAYVHALGAYGRFVETHLRETVPHGADPIAYLATRTGVDAERIRELYTRAVGAKDADEPSGDELSVIDELHRIVAKAMRAR